MASPAGSLPVVTAADVARGVSRWLLRAGIAPLAEVPFPNHRRADLFGVDAQGRLTLVEIKISLADLRGDRKWSEYLAWCDRFFWAVPPGLPRADLDTPAFQPQRTGVLVADRYDAELLREAAWHPLPPARRRAETLRFARRAAARLAGLIDPDGVSIPGD